MIETNKEANVSFLKRAFTTWWEWFVAYVIIVIAFAFVTFLFAFMVGLVS